MIDMPKVEAKHKELDRMLKVCVKFGIRELKFGDIHVVFGEVSQRPQKPRKAVMKQQLETERKADLQTKLDLVRDEISTSHVEDPVGFEDALAAGLLTNEETHDSGTESAL